MEDHTTLVVNDESSVILQLIFFCFIDIARQIGHVVYDMTDLSCELITHNVF